MKTRTLPLIKPRASRTPKRLETDLKTLAEAANEAAKREAAQWFYFVTIMLTLAAIVGSTTHRVLFLEDPVKVPLLSVELPLRGFYVAAPAIFVVLHFYLLAQVRLMAVKVRAFLDAARAEAGTDDSAFEKALKRIDGFSVAQLVVADRLGRVAPAVRAMAWVTLVVAPVLLLLFFQVRFLPFHSVEITWWHRVLVAADLLLLWALWPPLESARAARFAIHAARAAGIVLILTFSICVATIPNERADRWANRFPVSVPRYRARLTEPPFAVFVARLRGAPGAQRDDEEADEDLTPEESVVAGFKRALFDGRPEGISQSPTSVFSRNIVLVDVQTLSEREQQISPAASTDSQTLERTRILRGRNLQFAVLDGSDLRRADFSGANLSGASFRRARLQRAIFDGANLQDSILREAQLTSATFVRTHGHFADFNGSSMAGADLTNSRFPGATFGRANLAGTDFRHAQLSGADIRGADLRAADLDGADLRGADLSASSLRGATAVGADLQGARLEGANIAFARFEGNRVWGVNQNWFVDQNGSPAGGALWLSPETARHLPTLSNSTRATSWEAWIEHLLLEPVLSNAFEVSGHRYRTLNRRSVEQRLSVLADDEADVPASAWEATTRASISLRDWTRQVGLLACTASDNPHIAQSIARRLWDTAPSVRDLEARFWIVRSILSGRCVPPRPYSEAELRRLQSVLGVGD